MVLESDDFVPVWAYDPVVKVLDTGAVGIGVRLHNLNDKAWCSLFASSEGADEYEAQLTPVGVWIRTRTGEAAAALDWLHEAIDTTNRLREQLEADAKVVEAEVVEWEKRRSRAGAS
jgi:hypothetical protein